VRDLSGFIVFALWDEAELTGLRDYEILGEQPRQVAGGEPARGGVIGRRLMGYLIHAAIYWRFVEYRMTAILVRVCERDDGYS
jgi:hypothetical protein